MQPKNPLTKSAVTPPSSLNVSYVTDPTFRTQAEVYLERLATRKRKPAKSSTLYSWRSYLNKWIYPALGDLPLSQVKNSTVRPLIKDMSEAGLKPSAIDAHFRLVKWIVSSLLDEKGEPIYVRQWNYDFLDLPIVDPRTMNTPCFSGEIVSGLARWRYPREQMIFILAAASGARISELLGLEIGRHISPDCLTLEIKQQAYRCRIVPHVKTNASYRKIDLHLSVARMLEEFIGQRTAGLLFCTANGTPLADVLPHHLHPALRELGFVNACTGTHKAGMHALRRFRNTHLGKCPGLPERLRKFWIGHSVPRISRAYDKTIDDREFRLMWAQQCGIGFKLPFE